jgi:hypothetical protein
MESIVEAQHNMKKVHEYVKMANVVILRLWSIVLARSPKVSSTHPTDHSLCSVIGLLGYGSSHSFLDNSVLCVQHTETVIWMLTGLAVALAVVPFKYVLMGLTVAIFMANTRVVKAMSNPRGSRRWREWWESIPAVPVHTVDKAELRTA